MKEVPDNLDTMTVCSAVDTEENQIVAFLETLSDGFTTPYPTAIPSPVFAMTCNPPQIPIVAVEAGNGTLIRLESAAVRNGHLRVPPLRVPLRFPNCRRLNGGKPETHASILWLVRLAKSAIRADEPEPESRWR